MINNREKIRLIVTADDFGAGPGRNAGIVAAWRDGIVTGASLLANGAAFTEAAGEARALRMPVGVHLNLADGPPLGGPIANLTTTDGAFPGKDRSRQALTAGGVDPAALHRELTMQIETVLRAGLVPDYLDTHQHVFLFPVVTEIVIALARSFGIGRLRLPAPVEPVADDPDGPLGDELALYRRLAPAAADAIRAAGLISPDGLLGMPLLNRLDEENLIRLLHGIDPGCWELMTHPGRRDPGHPFGGVEREVELAALTAPAVRRCIAQREIELIAYRHLEPPCVS